MPQKVRAPAGSSHQHHQQQDLVLRALADPNRREILRLVRQHELAAGEIAARFTVTQQAVSQHIGVLKDAGLLTERREGTRRLYSLRPEALEPVRNLIAEMWPDALARLKKTVETAHPRPAKTPPREASS